MARALSNVHKLPSTVSITTATYTLVVIVDTDPREDDEG